MARVKSYNTLELNGFVYIWYHAEGIEPTWTPPEVEEITRKQWRYRGRTEHHVNAHIEVRTPASCMLLLCVLNGGTYSLLLCVEWWNMFPVACVEWWSMFGLLQTLDLVQGTLVMQSFLLPRPSVCVCAEFGMTNNIVGAFLILQLI